MADNSAAPQGCSFLINEVGSESIFCPEKFSEEQQMFGASAREFMEREVHPHIEDLEHQDFDKMVEILRKSADMGLLMMDVPEQYGGLGVDKTTSMIVTENLSTYAGVFRHLRSSYGYWLAASSVFWHSGTERKMAASTRDRRADRRIRVD